MEEFIINNWYGIAGVVTFSATMAFIAVFDKDDKIENPILPCVLLSLVWPAFIMIIMFGEIFSRVKSSKDS